MKKAFVIPYFWISTNIHIKGYAKFSHNAAGLYAVLVHFQNTVFFYLEPLVLLICEYFNPKNDSLSFIFFLNLLFIFLLYSLYLYHIWLINFILNFFLISLFFSFPEEPQNWLISQPRCLFWNFPPHNKSQDFLSLIFNLALSYMFQQLDVSCVLLRKLGRFNYPPLP